MQWLRSLSYAYPWYVTGKASLWMEIDSWFLTETYRGVLLAPFFATRERMMA